MTDGLPATIAEAATALRNRSLTSLALTKRLLAQTESLDAKLGTFIARFDQQVTDWHTRLPQCAQTAG